MKNSILFSLFVMALFVVSCGGPEGTKVASEEATEVAATTIAGATYMVDAAASQITWAGTKLVGEGHEGTISIADGKIAVAGDNIVGGKFSINMTSLATTDLEGEQKGKLEGHLKSADFFDVEKFPMATFDIASVNPVTGTEGISHTITGNLTMKGESRSISIPANVTMADGMLTASAPDFVIDRTEWGVKYGSNGSVADMAKDKVINDNIGLSLMLVAKK
jgi:polyisoprenoid-binding protein YceI